MSDADSNEEDEDIDYEGEPYEPFKGSKPAFKSGVSEDEDGDEDEDSPNSSDFIVEDDNVFALPAQFSMETHQDLSCQFKKIFQFFVHVAVQTPKYRKSFMKSKLAGGQSSVFELHCNNSSHWLDEDYFSVPLQAMRRKLSGMRDSLVSSSVWKPGFKKTLEIYPELSLIHLDFAVPYCDACNLGGRMSTMLAYLTGLSYDAVGFGSVGFVVNQENMTLIVPLISLLRMARKILNLSKKNITSVAFAQGEPGFTTSSLIGKLVTLVFGSKETHC